jgi:hypothetical protein
VRYLITLITLLGMEVCWLYAVLNAVNKAVSDRLFIPLLVLTLLVSFGVSRALGLIRWPKPALTALAWIVWPLVMLLMIKIQLFPAVAWADPVWLESIPQAFANIFYSFSPVLLIVAGTAILWWLGRRLAYLKVNFSDALTEFQFGLVMLVITYFVYYELQLDLSSSLSVALTFFPLGLIGISLSNDRENTWFSSARRGEWSGILLLSIGLVLLLGIFISLLVTPDLIQYILNAIKWVWGIIERLMYLLASLFPQDSTPMPAPEQGEMPSMDNETFKFALPEWMRPGFQIIYFILIGGFFLFAAYRVVSDILKWMRRRTSSSGGEVESLRGAFWADLLNWFKRIISRIFGIKFGSMAKKKSAVIPPDLAYVRQLYIQFLSWGAKKGFSRQKSQTPVEYTNTLGASAPENRPDIDYITGQYMAVRYGFNQPGEENINRLKQVWDNLRKVKFKK